MKTFLCLLLVFFTYTSSSLISNEIRSELEKIKTIKPPSVKWKWQLAFQDYREDYYVPLIESSSSNSYVIKGVSSIPNFNSELQSKGVRQEIINILSAIKFMKRMEVKSFSFVIKSGHASLEMYIGAAEKIDDSNISYSIIYSISNAKVASQATVPWPDPYDLAHVATGAVVNIVLTPQNIHDIEQWIRAEAYESILSKLNQV